MPEQSSKSLESLDSNIKTRFCPSPTGLLHLGNIRTALFNALLAKGKGGRFLLRIEDTDRERSSELYVEKLQRDLKWLGLDWDEGPGCDNDSGPGPYRQSKRQAIYDDYYQRLIDAGQAYPCFCSEQELAVQRKIQRAAGKPPRYPGTCARLSEAEVAGKKASGLQSTLRFRVAKNQAVQFHDLVRGRQRFQGEDIGDFIIRRANGTSPFMFCNSIDDSLMGVTHALRGEDHLTNTPRQIMILQALGLRLPIYGHIALITGPDSSPLSKRHGSRSVEELRAEGYLPNAVNNYLARLGHYYGHDELLNLDRLAAEFKIESLAKSPAKFNIEQLNYWQKEAVSKLDFDEFYQWTKDILLNKVPQQHQMEFVQLIKPNVIFPADVKLWTEIIFSQQLTLENGQREIIKNAGENYFSEAFNAYKQFGPDLPQIIAHLKNTLDIKGKALYLPLRVALTGQQHGPEMAKILLLMNKNEIYKRLETAR